MLKPLYLTENDTVMVLDQRRLPLEEVWLEIKDVDELASSIKTLAVRGAPAIGIAAAYGMYMAVKDVKEKEKFLERLKIASDVLSSTRPTAVNLFWALKRMEKVAFQNLNLPIGKLIKKLRSEAIRIHEEDIESCLSISKYGCSLVPERAKILTHCNAGALATGGYGTALGIVREAHKEGKVELVLVDETRPLLQGARLTAWEMRYEGIPYRVITDNMAGYFMAKGMVDMVIVGADRIALNGDTANKIGTYSLAILAKSHNIPFLVAAPISTFDDSIKTGEDIPIEERSEDEVLSFLGKRFTPEGSQAFNPAFDVTPSVFIDYIVTDKGIIERPNEKKIKNFLKDENKM